MYKITGADLGKVVQRIDERYENRLCMINYNGIIMVREAAECEADCMNDVGGGL